MSKVKVKYHDDSNYQCIYDNEGEYTGRMTDEYYYAEFDSEEEFKKWAENEYDIQIYTGFGIDEVKYE